MMSMKARNQALSVRAKKKKKRSEGAVKREGEENVVGFSKNIEF